jgi:hypothetical protein
VRRRLKSLPIQGIEGKRVQRPSFAKGKILPWLTGTCPASPALQGGELHILKRWIEEEAGNRKRRRFFEVRGSDDAIHRIVYDEESLQWFYVRKD